MQEMNEMKKDYSYQTPIVKGVVNALKSGKPTLLAAAPGAGKTVMALDVIDALIKEKIAEKILVIAHAQVVIRDQWVNYYNDRDYNFSIREIEHISDYKLNQDANVSIALPQSRVPLDLKIDTVVIDEAHLWTESPTIKKILARLKPKRLLLLTGTPGKFNHRDDIAKFHIPIEDLIDHGVIANPTIKVISTQYDYTLSEYLENMNLRKDFNADVKHNILSTERVFEILKEAGIYRRGAITKKVLFVCSSQQHAKEVAHEFTKKNIKNVISISAHRRDNRDSRRVQKEFNNFKNSKDTHVLIVVNRGILGFDFDNLGCVVDVSHSLNPDRLFQLLCRVVRKGAEKDKLYIKITNDALFPVAYFVMSFVCSLAVRKYYNSYIQDWKKQKIRFRQLENDPNPEVRTKENFINLPTLSFDHVIDLNKKEAAGFTDFYSVRAKAYGTTELWDWDKVLLAISRCKHITEFQTKFGGAYNWCKTNGRLEDVRAMLKTKFEKQSINRLKKTMKQYSTYKEFMNNERGLYNYAIKIKMLGFLKKYYNYKSPRDVYLEWTKERVENAAKKCKSRKEMKEVFRTAYHVGINKYPALINAYFPVKNFYKLDEVLKLAKNYDRLYKFREAHHGAYRFLKREGKLDLLPFDRQPKKWTDLDKAKKAAMKWHGKQRADFRKNNISLYDYLKKNAPEFLDSLKLEEFESKNRRKWTRERAIETLKKQRFKNIRALRNSGFAGLEDYLRRDHPDLLRKVRMKEF